MTHLMIQNAIPLTDFAATLPRLRGGRPIHPKTLRSWGQHGIRLGNETTVRLEIFRVGRTWCTTPEAFDRFLSRLNGGVPTNPSRSNKRADQAAEACAALGL